MGTGNSLVQTTTTISTSMSSNSQPKASSLNQLSGKQSWNWSGNSKGSNLGNLASRSAQPYEKHLGPDGKLKPKEVEHWKKAGLCPFCREKYTLNNCEKHKQNNQPQGRAATIQELTSKLLAIAEVLEN